MHYSKRTIRRRLSLLLTGGVLLAGGVGGSALLAVPAQAGTCVTPAACAVTGTLALTAGTLNLTTPGTLTWTATVTGADLNVVYTIPADQLYTVVDATGSSAGWHVTVAATTFTATGPVTLAAAGTFSTDGSTTSMTATGYPVAACTSGSTCTPPTHTTAPTTFPVAITTAASAPTPFVVYDANAATGIGSIAVNPVGWWLNVPGNTKPGSYVSSISMAVITAP